MEVARKTPAAVACESCEGCGEAAEQPGARVAREERASGRRVSLTAWDCSRMRIQAHQQCHLSVVCEEWGRGQRNTAAVAPTGRLTDEARQAIHTGRRAQAEGHKVAGRARVATKLKHLPSNKMFSHVGSALGQLVGRVRAQACLPPGGVDKWRGYPASLPCAVHVRTVSPGQRPRRQVPYKLSLTWCRTARPT